jgi:thioredoxin 1
MAGAHILTFDDGNFEAEVLKSELPVLVDFWAQWCGPCLMLAPTIEELAETYAGKAKVGKVNVDEAAGLASKYAIQNIPTVLIFHKGAPAERIVGAKHKREYQAVLDKLLSR